jgi:hypothetical protein
MREVSSIAFTRLFAADGWPDNGELPLRLIDEVIHGRRLADFRHVQIDG